MIDPEACHLVIDIGNTRVKFARVEKCGVLELVGAFDAAGQAGWDQLAEAVGTATRVRLAVSSVNPASLSRFETWKASRPIVFVSRDYRSAAMVPVRHALLAPELTGADRALAVLAALPLLPAGGGWVVSCGTAITVERVGEGGVWLGGAIAAGMGLLARSLNAGTAQLPLVEPVSAPLAWGAATRSAIEAGVYWGAVGAVRELLMRQGAEPSRPESIVWTGGDAERLSVAVCGVASRVEPDLVLRGLVMAAFGGDG